MDNNENSDEKSEETRKKETDRDSRYSTHGEDRCLNLNEVNDRLSSRHDTPRFSSVTTVSAIQSIYSNEAIKSLDDTVTMKQMDRLNDPVRIKFPRDPATKKNKNYRILKTFPILLIGAPNKNRVLQSINALLPRSTYRPLFFVEVFFSDESPFSGWGLRVRSFRRSGIMISHAFGLTPFSIVVGGKEARKKSGSAAKDAYARDFRTYGGSRIVQKK